MSGCSFGSLLSFREVEELMLARGVVVSYESIRRWCAGWGTEMADRFAVCNEVTELDAAA